MSLSRDADKKTLATANKLSRKFDKAMERKNEADMYFKEMKRRKVAEVQEKALALKKALVKQDSTSSESSMASGASGSSSFSEDPVVLLFTTICSR